MNNELFGLCGFDKPEITAEKPRIERAFEILDIRPDDEIRAIERIRKYFDIELLGIRKALGIWLKELLDMVLAKEEGKKIVYASSPPISQVMAAMTSASDDVYCVIPEGILCTNMNWIFDKMNPVLEVAEKNGLGPGAAFCSFLQVRLGAIIKGIIPVPDLLIPSCVMCDHSPKVDEMLGEIYDIPVAYIDHVFDSGKDGWPVDINPQRVKYLAGEMENAIDVFRKMFGYDVSEDKVRRAIAKEAELYNMSLQIWDLLKSDRIVLRIKDLTMATRIASACSPRALKEGGEVLAILKDEVRERIKSGKAVVKEGTPHIMVTMVPGDLETAAMFEELDMAVTATSMLPTVSGPSDVTYNSLWEEIADAIIRRRGANYSASAYMHQVKDLAEMMNVDGAVLFHHIGCRQYNTWIPMAKKVIEKELGIPVMVLEGDFCDSRNYNATQSRIRMETYAQIVKNAKKSPGGLGD